MKVLNGLAQGVAELNCQACLLPTPGTFRIQGRLGSRQAIHSALENITIEQGSVVGFKLACLFSASLPQLPPGKAATGHGYGGDAAESGHPATAIAAFNAFLLFSLAFLLFSLINAGLHEVAQFVAKLLRSLGEPRLGALELEAAEQCGRTLLLSSFLPLLEVLLHSLAADQELPILIQPVPQQWPLAQQRLVGHLQQAVAHFLAADQQAGVHQLLEQRLGLGRQRLPSRRAAHVVALLETHHRRHEGIAQGFHLLVGGLHACDHFIGASAYGVLQRRESALGIPQGLIVRQAEMAITAEALVQLPQREGQQRQGVLGFGIGCGLLYEGLLHLQARHPGWPLDDRRDMRHRHRRQRHLLEAGGEPVFLGRLQPAEEFRAQGHHRQEGQIAAQGGGENAEEALDFFRHQSAEQLLALIDRQQDLCLVQLRRHAEIASDLRQHRRQGSGMVALQQRVVQVAPA